MSRICSRARGRTSGSLPFASELGDHVRGRYPQAGSAFGFGRAERRVKSSPIFPIQLVRVDEGDFDLGSGRPVGSSSVSRPLFTLARIGVIASNDSARPAPAPPPTGVEDRLISAILPHDDSCDIYAALASSSGRLRGAHGHDVARGPTSGAAKGGRVGSADGRARGSRHPCHA